jgi:Predicted membrane protein (DUF2339)
MGIPERPTDAESLKARIEALESELAGLRQALRAIESVVPAPPPTLPPAAPPRVPAPQVPFPPPALPTRREESLERFVGGRVIAAIGAIVLTVGLGALVHLAYRQGWFATFGPMARMAVGYVASGLVIALGEITLRRYGRAAAIGFAAAGIAGLYVTTYVGTALGHVFAPVTALVVATAIVVLGTLLTLRLAALPVAIIAALGAYMAPGVTDAFRDAPLFTAIHLTICLASSLILVAVRPQPFWFMRFISLPLHGLVALVWLLQSAWQNPTLALVFVILWWAMYVGEAWIAALRGTTPRSNVVVAFLATLVASGFVAPVLGELVPWSHALAYAPIAMALAAGIGSFLLPNLDTDDAQSDADLALVRSSQLFRTGLRLIAALLSALALAPFLGPAALAIAWAAFAVAAVESDRRGALRGGRLIGLAVLVLSLVAAFAAGVTTRGGSWFTIEFDALIIGFGELRIGAGSAAFAAVAAGAIGFVLRSNRAARGTVYAAALVGLLAWTLASLIGGDAWMRIILLAVAPVALTVARRGLLPLLGILAGALALTAWCFMELGVFERRWESSMWGVDVALAAIIVGAANFGAQRAEAPAVRRIAQIAASIMVSVAVGFIGYVNVAGIVHRTGGLFEARIGIAAACVAVAALIMHLYARGFGAAALALASIAQLFFAGTLWAVASVAVPAMQTLRTSEMPFVNVSVALAIVLIASTIVAWRTERRYQPDSLPTMALAGLALGEIVVILSREVAGLVAMIDPKLVAPSLSLLWGAGAIGLIVYGFARSQVVARWVGLVTLAFVAAKVLLWDMRSTDTLLRVVIMLLVGGIMVVTSILYVRRSQASKGTALLTGETGKPPEDSPR